MADDSKTATLRSNLSQGVNTPRTGQGVMVDVVVEVTAAADANSRYVMARIPSSARIHGTSRIHADDLASSGSPTLQPILRSFDQPQRSRVAS